MGGVSFRLGTARQVGREIAAINRKLVLAPPLAVRLHEKLRLAVIWMLNLLPQKIVHRLADLVRQPSGKPTRWSFD